MSFLTQLDVLYQKNSLNLQNFNTSSQIPKHIPWISSIIQRNLKSTSSRQLFINDPIYSPQFMTYFVTWTNGRNFYPLRKVADMMTIYAFYSRSWKATISLRHVCLSVCCPRVNRTPCVRISMKFLHYGILFICV